MNLVDDVYSGFVLRHPFPTKMTEADIEALKDQFRATGKPPRLMVLTQQPAVITRRRRVLPVQRHRHPRWQRFKQFAPYPFGAFIGLLFLLGCLNFLAICLAGNTLLRWWQVLLITGLVSPFVGIWSLHIHVNAINKRRKKH